MRFKKFFYVLTALLIALASIGAVESYAVSKSGKAKTTATAKKKTTAKKRSAKKKSTTKKSSKKKKTSKKRKTSKRRKKGRAIVHKQYTPPVETPLNDSLTLFVNSEVLAWIPENLNPGGLRVNSVKPDSKTKTAKIIWVSTPPLF